MNNANYGAKQPNSSCYTKSFAVNNHNEKKPNNSSSIKSFDTTPSTLNTANSTFVSFRPTSVKKFVY